MSRSLQKLLKELRVNIRLLQFDFHMARTYHDHIQVILKTKYILNVFRYLLLYPLNNRCSEDDKKLLSSKMYKLYESVKPIHYSYHSWGLF